MPAAQRKCYNRQWHGLVWLPRNPLKTMALLYFQKHSLTVHCPEILCKTWIRSLSGLRTEKHDPPSQPNCELVRMCFPPTVMTNPNSGHVCSQAAFGSGPHCGLSSPTLHCDCSDIVYNSVRTRISSAVS